MKKILSILIIIFTMISCKQKGDYKYLIYMKNGEIVKAWDVSSSIGGNLYVRPPYHTSGDYYLSSSSFIKAEYVGTFNIKGDEK